MDTGGRSFCGHSPEQDKEVARQIGRTLKSVRHRRRASLVAVVPRGALPTSSKSAVRENAEEERDESFASANGSETIKAIMDDQLARKLA